MAKSCNKIPEAAISDRGQVCAKKKSSSAETSWSTNLNLQIQEYMCSVKTPTHLTSSVFFFFFFIDVSKRNESQKSVREQSLTQNKSNNDHGYSLETSQSSVGLYSIHDMLRSTINHHFLFTPRATERSYLWNQHNPWIIFSVSGTACLGGSMQNSASYQIW